MGKSPGKWMKTILFGRKTSKSKLSKGTETTHSSEKAAFVSANQPASDLAVNPLLISQPVPYTADEVILSSANQGGDAQGFTNLVSLTDSEKVRLEQAATTTQAAFRGYLARRAFRTLKGIIRLQALIRGYLVRRQAVATFYCVHRIVKLQVLVRGKKDPKHLDSYKTCTSTRVEKLSDNAFIRKLLSSSPATTPLHLQYGPGEPNSAWDWLNRWTISQIWEPASQPKKILDSKSHMKQENPQTVEVAQVRPKRSVQKPRTANVENGSSKSPLESDKLKHKRKKVLNIPVNSVHEQSENGIEKVKRNLKKTSNPTKEASNQQEMDTEKTKHIHIEASILADPDVSDQTINNLVENAKKDREMEVPKPSDVETSPKLPGEDGTVDELHDHHTVDLQPKQGGNDNIALGDNKLGSEVITLDNELQKTVKRRASLTTDQDCEENGLHNTPSAPSYMAATKSAKAKFRGQNSQSPRFDQDGTEKNSVTRRYSLPSSTNGNLTLSPRVQKLVLATGKGVIRSDKSLLSSRDGNEKVIQAEWKR